MRYDEAIEKGVGIVAILLGDLRAALVDAGASEELANKAATEAATYENRLASIETKLSVLTWMVGINVSLAVAILFRIFH